MGTPPREGRDVIGSVPLPIYSNEWLDASILLCLKNGTVTPTPTEYGSVSFIVIVQIPEEIGVDSLTV